MEAVPASPAPPGMTEVRDERSKEIDRTKTGLVLLAVATLLSWIPVIQLLGLVIGAIAVVLILLGASAFGSRHVYFVWASVSVFCVATVALVGLAATFADTIRALPIETSGPKTTAQVLAAFDTLLYGSLVIVSILSLCSALIAFELEDVPGRILLAVGVAAQIAISVSLFVLVLIPLVHHSIEEAFATTPPNMSVITAADDQVRSLRGLSVLNSVPALLFVGGYVWAYLRISSGATLVLGKGPTQPPRSLLAGIIGVIVLVAAAEAAALGAGILPITPRPPPTWHNVKLFSGNGTGTTENFAITGTQSSINVDITDNGPGGYSFSFTVYQAGTTTEAGTCGSYSGGPGPSSWGCRGPSRPGSYYIVVTDATGVDSWTITVAELA